MAMNDRIDAGHWSNGLGVWLGSVVSMRLKCALSLLILTLVNSAVVAREPGH